MMTYGQPDLKLLGKTREILVAPAGWDACWKLQFPETIACQEGWFMDYPPFGVDWQATADGGFTYSWHADASHLQTMQQFVKADPTGFLAKKSNLTGISLVATITPEPGGVQLGLALTNRSKQPIQDCVSDGGCFQARSPAFTAENEIARSFVRQGNQEVSLSKIARTEPLRGMYHHDRRVTEHLPWREGTWFWGESDFRPDFPAMIGMRSVDGERVVVFGYEQAGTVSANSDVQHHCIHSSPYFGTLEPGQTVERRGYILFRSEPKQAMDELRTRIVV